MASFDSAALGARIRRRRLEFGIQQKDLAKEVGLSVSFYGHIERGTRIPSLPTLVAIANYLKTGLDYLLRDSLDNVSSLRVSGWTDRELGVLREYLEEQNLDYDTWFLENEPAEDGAEQRG